VTQNHGERNGPPLAAIQDLSHDLLRDRCLIEGSWVDADSGDASRFTIRQLGPLINHEAVTKVRAHVDDALGKGARLLSGGPHRCAEAGGSFYPPTVLGDATTSMLIAREETFGPVAALFRFGAEAEAIALANDTEYGLAGYFYSRDLARAWRVAEQLETGMVGINSVFLSVEAAPFGGIKQSGIGREGSRHAIDEFIELKYLAFGGID
jgi:succinate-semialdehyde dehydrogenase / glutarate-semialdehyde dehydrogenase